MEEKLYLQLINKYPYSWSSVYVRHCSYSSH